MTSEQYTLHLIFSLSSWQTALPTISNQDRVLFLQDSVFLAQTDISSLNTPTDHTFARGLDINARNIKPNPHIEVIDDEQWLELTEKAQNIISW